MAASILGMNEVSLSGTLFLFLFLFLIILSLAFLAWKRKRAMHNGSKAEKEPMHRKTRPSHGRKSAKGIQKTILAILCVSGSLGLCSSVVHASVPQQHVYTGHLFNNANNPRALTDPVSIRFSYWKSQDWLTGDTLTDGTLNTSADNYLEWNEVHAVTPDSNGYFSVELGSVTPMPSYGSLPAGTSVFLQVDIKAASDPVISYELLDTDDADASVDRSPVLSVPFAVDTQTVQGLAPGTGSGAIPVLGSGGLLDTTAIPGATNEDFFVIDADDTSATSVSLQFGQTLAETLSYSLTNNRFEFSNDVHIEGDLSVSGLVNGIDLSGIESNAPLKVSTGSDLSVSVTGGGYRINGEITTFDGSGSVTLHDDADNYLFFTETGMTISTSSFPSDRSFIPLATVTTAGGAVQSVQDRRVLQSDDRESHVATVLHPDYDGASLQGDGSDNVGRMFVSSDEINLKNFYVWTSTRPALQDYNILIRSSLSPQFVRWDDGMTLEYRSTSAFADDNAVSIQVYDTNGVPVSLSGSTMNLAGIEWQSTDIEFLGSPTWTPGGEFMVRLTLSARSDSQMHIGDLRLNTVLLGE